MLELLQHSMEEGFLRSICMLTLCRGSLFQTKILLSTASALHLKFAKKSSAISGVSKEYPGAPNVGIGVVILRKLAHEEQVGHELTSGSSRRARTQMKHQYLMGLHSTVVQVLLVRRGKEPQKGMLTFPGGSLELGETMADCAIRETMEETGLKLKCEGNQGRLALSKNMHYGSPLIYTCKYVSMHLLQCR